MHRTSATARDARRLLVLSQVYPPDPASVGQHMADAAVAMAGRGWNVLVLAANRGYDDPSMKYARREVRDGVSVRRLPLSSFGKSSIVMRLIAGSVFMVQCILRGLFAKRPACILVSTSPPMCSIAAMVIAAVRRAPIKYWVMDLNPDQMIALGRITERSLPARVFNAINRAILRRADDVIVLDRFMAERVNRKADVRAKQTLMPPWPHDDHLAVVDHADNPFRAEHRLDGRFVIMYSGNHGFSTPVSTVLQAALALQDEPRLLFMFIGGGVGKKEVEDTIARHRPRNVVSLPYQPLEMIKYSLSAADVHLVSVGDPVVGVVHPCKVYGAMAVARPILLLGPDPCHVSDLLKAHCLGWHIRHGDVPGAVATIRGILGTPAAELAAMGRRGRDLVTTSLSKAALCGRFCDVLERGTA
jgi:putative colanic acid biosynthesis glycosyltransferase WcaI